MSSFNKTLLVVGFTLALLIVASDLRAAADCEARTGIICTSDEMCVAICLQRGGGFTGGYCSTEHVVGDPSCDCTPCAPQSATAAQGEKQLAGNGDAAARVGMAN